MTPLSGSTLPPVNLVAPQVGGAAGGIATSEASDTDSASRRPGESSQAAPGELTEEELREVERLRARDREVRAHEAAHQAVGGPYAGAVSFVYERGPDGLQYAVGGEVPIDVAPVPGDPQATIDKMRTVRAAALAPVDPSPQDFQVAAQASRQQLEAQLELAREQREAQAEAGSNTALNRTASDTYQAVGRGEVSRGSAVDALA
ncbi:MAG: hypothetical protein LAT63_06265 [Marinobacter sp.]|nr:hypothetical protein [Marinobacter sp.]